MRASRTALIATAAFVAGAVLAGSAYRSLAAPAGPFSGAAIREMPQLAEETKLWVAKIREVDASGQPVRLENDGSAESLARLREYLGPYVPVERLAFLEIKPGKLFALKMKEKHRIDIPYPAEHYIIRVTFNAKVIKGRLVEAKTMAKATPVNVIAFDEPQQLGIDRLNEQFESTVPSIGKLLGLLPHVIALVHVEGADGPLVAPQLDGLGVPENARLFKELLKLDDTLVPETILASAE